MCSEMIKAYLTSAKANFIFFSLTYLFKLQILVKGWLNISDNFVKFMGDVIFNSDFHRKQYTLDIIFLYIWSSRILFPVNVDIT